ncbi:MAG: hypothetical protein PHU85_10270 [Phycisphaerae bacterium]|nr:hypothetical protein [Phycisphaerae bacterium]
MVAQKQAQPTERRKLSSVTWAIILAALAIGYQPREDAAYERANAHINEVWGELHNPDALSTALAEITELLAENPKLARAYADWACGFT